MTDGELLGLLRDCLVLWNVAAKVTSVPEGLAIDAPDGRVILQRAAPDLCPVRWLLQTPARAAAGRPPRAVPSIVAALSALRNALGAAGDASLRIGSR